MMRIVTLDSDDEAFEFGLPELTEASDLNDYLQRVKALFPHGSCRALFVEGHGGDQRLAGEVERLRSKFPSWKGRWVVIDFGKTYLMREIVSIIR